MMKVACEAMMKTLTCQNYLPRTARCKRSRSNWQMLEYNKFI